MFFNAGGNRQNIRIKNNIFGCKAHFIDQDSVAARADLKFALGTVRLAALVKRHHDHGGAEALNHPRLGNKFFRTFLQADRIYNSLAL